MENVVYILGAGFSAPLGIPVMSNFLMKSKDMYFENREKYAHFGKVFDKIRDMAYAKNYYDCDLSNIEEILSILEMQESLGNKKSSKFFIKYIIDVISYHTPELKFSNRINDINIRRWFSIFFGENLISKYALFVGSLFSFNIVSQDKADYGNRSRQFEISVPDRHPTKYSIISLNYDMILENLCDFFDKINSSNTGIAFSSECDQQGCCLAKLHGSIHTEDIIPPTWNKSLKANLDKQWKVAYNLLQKANQIRILGYSLPETDSYIKYLLKSSVISAPHLKKIDIICLDDNLNSTRNRYDSFLEKRYYRFKNIKIENYLNLLFQKMDKEFAINKELQLSKLETTHNLFFGES